MRPPHAPRVPHSRRRPHVASIAILAVALFGVSACADAPHPAAPVVQPALVAALDIEDQLLAEKARIAAALDASEAAYDSLANLWDAYEDGNATLDDDRFARCEPLQYVATVKIIGADGGTLDFGPHSLRIPPGAVLEPTVITAEGPTALRVEARLSPHGLRFARPATLVLGRRHCEGNAVRTHRIVYLGTGASVLEWMPSDDDAGEGEVRTRIAHFSAYAVAY